MGSSKSSKPSKTSKSPIGLGGLDDFDDFDDFDDSKERMFMMRKYPWYIAIVALVFMLGVVFHVSTQTDTAAEIGKMEMDSESHAEEGEDLESHAEHGLVPVTDEKTKKILYWTCVMHPAVRMQD